MAASTYALGEPPPQTKATASFETKPSVADYTGGGYERVRSYEYVPEENRKKDVYAYIHRLNAVAWLLPEEEREGFLSLLDGVDVHHSAPEVPEEWGVPWDNREACLHLREHGRHSEITQAQMRAWAEESKRTVERQAAAADDGPTCDRCGSESETLAESADWDGRYCPPCTRDASEGAPIEVV